MEHHKLLKRQIRKYLKGVEWQTHSELAHFIENVDKAYKSFEKDKKLSQQAFDVADQEYREITTNLQNEKAIRDQSIANLMNIIQATDEVAYNDEEDNLLQISLHVKRLATLYAKNRVDLLKALEKSEDAAKAKADFLSVMSHEIRSPLGIIIGIIHVLLQENYLKEQEENLNILKITSNNLMMLVNDVLDYSKIEAGKLQLEEQYFDIKHLIRSIVRANHLKAQDRGNTIAYYYSDDEPFYVKGDSVRIGQIITNLVSNAIKFTKNGAVNVSLNLRNRAEQYAKFRISVQDTGIGIPQEKHQLIFDAFSQANTSTTRKFGGTGLGLSISQSLLQLMQSRLQLESEVGKGSKFFFNLELAYSEQAYLVDKKYVGIDDFQAARILVVDDVKYNRLLIGKLLKKKNVALDYAKNGQEAVHKTTENEYDLIFMDIQMPVMDGIEAAKHIRASAIHTPIIALTAMDNTERQSFLDAGMNDFIAKPFSPKNFYARIQRHIFL